MKERLTNNLGLKLLSIFFAFFVWLVVVNISNPVVTRSKEVVVDIKNERILTTANLTYEIVGKNTVTVSYDVRTRDEYKIKSSDFLAYIDLADLYDVTGSVPVEVEVLENRELLVGSPMAEARPGVLRVKTEKIQRKGFDLQIKFVGSPEEGYALGLSELSDKYVYVEGPESLVGQINSVGIEINVDNANSDVSGTAIPIFYDANGNNLTLGEKVTIDKPEIQYQQQILKAKNLILDFEVGGKVADGYRFTGIECDTKSVSVVGLKSVLANLTTITIPQLELNMEGATKDKVVTVDISKYLPPSAAIVGNNHMVTLTIKVEALEVRTVALPIDEILLTGNSALYDYTFDQDIIQVSIRGLSEDLDSLSESDLHAVIDVTDLVPGSHPGVISFNIGEAFEIINYTEFHTTVLSIAEETTEVGATVESTSGTGNETESGESVSPKETAAAETTAG